MNTSPPKPRSGRELVIVAAALIALLLAEFAVGNAFSLFSRYFWYDEWLSHTIVTDPDLGHSMKALAGGVETHPPSFYLLLRAYLSVLGRSDETALRSFAFLNTIVALLGVYATLRLRYAALPSFAGVLALSAHSLVVFHTVEARPYNVLFAGVAWLAYFLVRCRVRGFNARIAIGLVVTTVLVCTTHYFGILAVGLLVVGDAALSYRSGTGLRAPAVVLVTGLLAVLCCYPMLRSQRAAITVPTWLVLDRKAISEAFQELFAPLVLFVFLVWIVGVSLLWTLRRLRKSSSGIPRGAIRLYSGVIALGLLPFVLLAMSYLYQPVLLGRYALVGILPLAVVVAWLCSGQKSWVVVILCVAFCVTATWELHKEAARYRARDLAYRDLFTLLEECDKDAPFVFQHPIRLAFVLQYAPDDLTSRSYHIDYDRNDVQGMPDSLIFNRDLARRYAEYYGRPLRLMHCSAFSKHRVLFLVSGDPDFTDHFPALKNTEHLRLKPIGADELKFPVADRADD